MGYTDTDGPYIFYGDEQVAFFLLTFPCREDLDSYLAQLHTIKNFDGGDIYELRDGDRAAQFRVWAVVEPYPIKFKRRADMEKKITETVTLDPDEVKEAILKHLGVDDASSVGFIIEDRYMEDDWQARYPPTPTFMGAKVTTETSEE